MENQIETLYMIIALLAILLGGLAVFFFRQFLLSKNKIPNEEQLKTIQELLTANQELLTANQKLQAKNNLKEQRALQLGKNNANGGIAEFLGNLGVSIIQKFDILCMLPSTSKKPSVDAIGFNDDIITFIEFKKSGANLTSKEKKVKKLIEEGKVNYEIVDVNLPDDLTTIREPKESNLITS